MSPSLPLTSLLHPSRVPQTTSISFKVCVADNSSPPLSSQHSLSLLSFHLSLLLFQVSMYISILYQYPLHIASCKLLVCLLFLSLLSFLLAQYLSFSLFLIHDFYRLHLFHLIHLIHLSLLFSVLLLFSNILFRVRRLYSSVQEWIYHE